MRNKIIIISLLFFFGTASAQNSSLYMPVNLLKTYADSTRSYSGNPGKKYWQNSADYKISASINPETRELAGNENVKYFNNSPDTLKQITIRLYPDIYRKGNARDFEADPASIDDGMNIKQIFVDGKEVALNGSNSPVKRGGTNMVINLSSPLLPGSALDLAADWSYIIKSESQIRTGAYDKTSYLVAYWYPQIAVYDDIDGWDMMDYTGQVEFYNDFNNYDVSITMPKNFLVWATGVLQNPEEVYSPEILSRYKKAYSSDEIVNIVKEDDYKNGVTADKDYITYKFKAEKVTDFAFGTSDHYLWDGSSLVVDKQTGRRTFIDAAYKKESKDFYEVASIARKSVKFLSFEMPGVPFPYPKITVFNGDGGMEFPMMVNDGSSDQKAGTVHVTSHEISHTYFPFYMGINERKYAWMDEGWATMLPCGIQSRLAPGYDPVSRNAQSYSEGAGREYEQPCIVPSYILKAPAYRYASYRRPGAAYNILKDMLGDDVFKKTLHEYIRRWNGKHPMPFDFFFTFNDVAGNLDWFWKPWFFEHKYPDLSLSYKIADNGESEVSIKNKSGMPVPVKVKAIYADGSEEIIYDKTAKQWSEGNVELKAEFKPKGKLVKLELGNPQIPDVNTTDNIVNVK